jgi:hypothetical protein
MSDKREAINPRELDALMDKAAVRTAADLEQKYNIGQSFAEVAGIANDARKEAEAAKESVDSFDSDFQQEELYKRLTKNGTIKGLEYDGTKYLFRGGNINNLPDLFKNTVSFEVTAILVPGKAEAEALEAHLDGGQQIPEEYLSRYDLNGDSEADEYDLEIIEQVLRGNLENYTNKHPSTFLLTINFTIGEKFIKATGTNAWGNNIDIYIGMNDTNIKNLDTEKRLYELEQRIAALENS